MSLLRPRTLAAVVLVVAPLFAQEPTHSDFSGTWSLDTRRSASPTFEGFVGPVTVVIQQRDPTLVITTTRGPKTETITYDFDPAGRSRSSSEAPARTNPSFRWYWDGSNIVTESIRNTGAGPEGTYRTKQIRSLSDDGAEMVVEMTLVVEHGYDFKGTRNYGTGKDVYKRVVQ